MPSKPILSLKIVSILLALLIGACASPSEQVAEEVGEPIAQSEVNEEDGQQETQPPRLVSAEILLDPAVVALDDEASLLISSYIYSGLVRMENGEVVSDMAASWSVTDDGLTYQFELRPDLVFEDGIQVTSDEVMDNFNRWFDPKSGLRNAGDTFEAWAQNFEGFKGEEDEDGNPLSSFDGVEKVDNITFLLHFNRPVENLLEILAQPSFSILSPDALAAGDFGTSSELVISSGPYNLATWSDEGLELLPNSSYWGDVPESGLQFTFE